jgi:ATP-dependent exoDNAse (exonuclease V) beta subunit
MSDERIRQEALDISKSFIVQAPAGSGKTEVLTNRYLKLLATVNNPENILALTFTKKAVAELKLRIINSIKAAQDGIRPTEQHKELNYNLALEVLQKDKKYNWNLLKNISRIQVMTFDSLAAKISRSYKPHNRLTNLNLIDDVIDIYKISAQNLLQNITNSEAKDSIIYLLKHLDNNTNSFVSLVATMLDERNKWLERINNKSLNSNAIKQTIKNITDARLADLTKFATQELTFEFFDLATINTWYVNFKHLPQSLDDYLELANLCLTKSGTIRKQLTKRDGFSPYAPKDKKSNFISYIAGFSPNFVAKLHNLRLLPQEIDEELLTHIIKVLLLANFELENQFAELGGVDYTQISLNANNMLASEEVYDIALSLDNKISHILIDEFQDTSFTQLELISLMVANWERDKHHTLFIVGDPMQSIYLFRGAQVEVFLTVWSQGLDGIKLNNLTLSNNFRSSKTIVEHNNKVFSQIFPNEDDNELGQVKYTPAQSIHPATDGVFCHAFARGEEELELKKIRQIVTNNNGKSIAILARNKKIFIPIAQMLSAENVEFSAYENIKLTDDIFIKDLLTICTILLSRNNKLAWLSLMRSPYVGLELDELLEFSDITDIYNYLANSKNHKLFKLYQIFNLAFSKIGVFSFVNVFNSVIRNLAIHQIINPIQNKSLGLFSEVLYNLESQNELSLELIKAKLDKLFVPSVASKVQLMSVHQAKGLEFDIVILPNLATIPPVDKGKLLYITEFVGNGTLFAPKSESKIYNFLRNNSTTRLNFEMMRLLYVAMSRAKEELHLSACADINKIAKKSFLYLLKDIYGDLWQDKTPLKQDDELEIINNYKYDLDLKPTLKPIEYTESIDKFDLNTDIFAKLGIIVHSCLQYENFNPNVQEIDYYLNKYNLIADSNKYNKIIVDLLLRVKNCDDFEFIFQARDSTLVEVEFIDKNKTYIIDRLFIENNTVYIIDFKVIFSKLTTKLLTKYKSQLNAYAQVVKKIYNYEIKTAIFLVSEARLIYV